VLPVRTTSKGPGAGPPADPQAGAAAGQAPDFEAAGFDPEALEQAAQRLRPSWEPEAGHAEPGEVEASAPSTDAAESDATAGASAGREDSEPLLLQIPASPKMPNIQVKPEFSAFERGLVGNGAPPTIIVNEPGMVVLDSPPADLLSSAPSPLPAAPEVARPAPVTPTLSRSTDDDLDLAPPMKSRAPWLLVAVAAVAVAAAAMFAVRGHTDSRATLKLTPAARVEPVAAPVAPVAAPEPPPAVAEAPPAAEAVPGAAPAEPSPALAAPAEPPAAEPAAQAPSQVAAAAHEEPAPSRRSKRARAAASARQPTAGRATRASQAKASVEPAAPKPAAAASGKKSGRKGAGFVSTNPYD
jgi:hypothetical protein